MDFSSRATLSRSDSIRLRIARADCRFCMSSSCALRLRAKASNRMTSQALTTQSMTQKARHRTPRIGQNTMH